MSVHDVVMDLKDIEPDDEIVPTLTLVAAGFAGALLAASGLALGMVRWLYHD